MNYQQTIQHYRGAVYDGVQKLVEFLDTLSRMYSPMEMVGRAQISPIEEVVHQQSKNYPPVPQNTYPTNTNGWHMRIPYNSMIDSKKPRNGNKYSGWRIKQSTDIYGARAAKKPNKAPVPIPSKQKRRRAKWDQPNLTPRKTHILYFGRV